MPAITELLPAFVRLGNRVALERPSGLRAFAVVGYLDCGVEALALDDAGHAAICRYLADFADIRLEWVEQVQIRFEEAEADIERERVLLLDLESLDFRAGRIPEDDGEASARQHGALRATLRTLELDALIRATAGPRLAEWPRR
ncbi:hypothetical protein J2T57_001575 [Natronocella acetinitrilica]|uniref:Uncharacterized protein n=1 Tax=Natronocella acetinitrilica TaxID=414046 RepID=A0AAE3G4X7_9GAMM|nr:hypothetical protein [Natronocella acetinitrilica]MCP1674473.1 hypothetical protein [Natronocella acetinitrilica]